MSNSSPSGAAARAAGYRPCLRCEPDEVNREEVALDKAFRLLAAAEEAPSLEELAAAVGYSPHHFHRLFKRATGVTPAAYARSLRAQRAEAALAERRADHRRDLRCRLFGAGPLLRRCREAARHDPVRLARRRPRRDDPLGDRRDRSRHDAGRGDRARAFAGSPSTRTRAALRRRFPKAEIEQGGRATWRIWSGARWRR